jgi:pimeloyl-ACP methyl ester carboxylesterase
MKNLPSTSSIQISTRRGLPDLRPVVVMSTVGSSASSCRTASIGQTLRPTPGRRRSEAATVPDRVSHLVIYSSYTHTTLTAHRRAAWRAHLEEGWGTGVMDGLIVQHGDATSRDALARLERYSCTPSMVGEKAMSDADLDVRSALGAITAPTLVLHNIGDPFMRIESSRAIASAIPGARFASCRATSTSAGGRRTPARWSITARSS